MTPPPTPVDCQPKSLPPSASADPAHQPTPDTNSQASQSTEPCAGAPSHPSSLGTHELNAQLLLSNLSPYERYRHDCWSKAREETARTLDRCGTGPKVLAKFCSCGSIATVQQHNHLPDLFRVRCSKCRHRLCFPCQREKGCIIEHNLAHVAATAGNRLSLLTLTLKHNDRHLRPELTRLITAFRELRRTLLWKRNVTAGAWTVEIKIGKDGRWHPHIHCLIDASYMEQGYLSQAWFTCTGDSTDVDIRRINAHRGARYIAKYVTKPHDASILPGTDRFEEYAIATKGLRKCATLGTWRGTPLAEHEQDEELLGTAFDTSPDQWHQIDTLDNLLSRISAGETLARDIFSKLGLRPKRGPP